MDTFWITFGSDFGEGYKPDFRIHFNKPEQDEGYQCIKVCSYEVVEKLETENARYREALEFYADGENVIAQKTDPKFSEIEKEMELLSDDFDVSVENGYWVKGKLARQALKEME